MPSKVDRYVCIIISPSDALAQRTAVRAVIADWNNSVGRLSNIDIEARGWEDTRPQLGGHPQTVIDKEEVNHADFGIAFFAERLGTPTLEEISGSISEIKRIHEHGGDVMVYRSTKSVKRENIAEAQRLEEGLKQLERKGLLGSYRNTQHLADQVRRHLTDMLLKKRSNPEPTALRPDVRVRVGTAITRDTSGLNVSLGNHSKETVYGANVQFLLKDMFRPDVPMTVELRDIFGERMRDFVLHPGQSKTWFVPLDSFFLSHQFAPEKLDNVVLHDQINRRYDGDATELKQAIAALRHQVDPEKNRQAVLARIFAQLQKSSG